MAVASTFCNGPKSTRGENVFIVPSSWMPIFASQEIVKAIHDDALLLLEGAGRCSEVVCLFWGQKKRYVVFFASSLVTTAFVAT